MSSTRSVPLTSIAFRAVFVTLFASVVSGAAPVPPPQSSIATVGIFGDGRDLPAEGYFGAHDVKNLLGHFGLRGELIRLEDYKAGQLGHYTAAFYLGTVAKTIPPDEFLSDVRVYAHPFCWPGQHIDKLVGGGPNRFGFRYIGNRRDRTSWRVEYRESSSLEIISVSSCPFNEVERRCGRRRSGMTTLAALTC